MNNRLLYDLINKGAQFFECREKAVSICESFADYKLHSKREWELMYDFCFRGMDADVNIPLWASVCMGEKVLLNSTTLEVIEYYHKWGYEPEWIEGNPADYIGEQFKFLAYLMGADCTENNDERVKAANEFVENYLLATLSVMLKALKEYKDCYSGIVKFTEEILFTLSDNDIKPENCSFESYKLNVPIESEEEQIIASGGLNNCGGICVIRPHVKENCLLQIESDCNASHSPQIRACVRGRGYRKTFLSPDRLRYPMKRIGERGSGKFERISWEEAVDIVAENTMRIGKEYGPSSRYLLYGTGVCGIMRPGLLATRLLSLDGGYLGFFNSYSSACVTYISDYVYGCSDGNSASDLLNTKLLILWSHNPAETIFGPERNYYLSELKKKGVKIVCIDPRLSQTGITYADDWFALKPSTDAALADAMCYVIYEEGLQDQAFMDKYCLGFDEDHMPEGVPANESYHSYLFGLKDGIKKTPEWAEKITGIEAERIRALAIEYATTKPACIDAGYGAQRHGNGEQSSRGIMALACLTGNVGKSGGSNGSNCGRIKEHSNMGNFIDPVNNPYPGLIPTFLWTKAIEHGTEMTPLGDRIKGVDKLDSNIKMIFCLASDVLINQHSNINDTIRILKDDSKCEMIVCSDIFMTPSARYADVILPATSVFEGENIIGSWAGTNYYLKHNKVINPMFGCRFEWEWLKEVSEKMGLFEKFTAGMPDMHDWLTTNYEIMRGKEPELPDFDTFSKEGGWQFKEQVHAVAFEKEINNPEKYPFPTPSGKIEIFSKALYDYHQEDIPAIPMYTPCPEGPEDKLTEKYPLQLIGWHTRRRCHSIHDNNEWQDEIEMPGVWIHPDDAEARGIQNGEKVDIFNDRGCVRIPAIVTTRIAKGVAAIAQGAWFTPDGEGIDTRGCINTLTSTAYPTPIAKGNPQHTNLVEIKKI